MMPDERTVPTGGRHARLIAEAPAMTDILRRLGHVQRIAMSDAHAAVTLGELSDRASEILARIDGGTADA